MSENKLKDTLSIASPFIMEREDAKKEYRTDKGWKVYKDKLAEDKLTVGPGLTADTGYAELQKMKADETIPHETINSLFGNFLKTTDTQLKKEFPNIYPTLNKNQQASLVSLIYNTGMETFKHPTKTNKTSFAYDALKEAGKHLDNAEMKNKFLDEVLYPTLQEHHTLVLWKEAAEEIIANNESQNQQLLLLNEWKAGMNKVIWALCLGAAGIIAQMVSEAI